MNTHTWIRASKWSILDGQTVTLTRRSTVYWHDWYSRSGSMAGKAHTYGGYAHSATAQKASNTCGSVQLIGRRRRVQFPASGQGLRFPMF
jgi:hypothetical protein